MYENPHPMDPKMSCNTGAGEGVKVSMAILPPKVEVYTACVRVSFSSYTVNKDRNDKSVLARFRPYIIVIF